EVLASLWKISSALSRSCFFHVWIIVGCTPCSDANSLTVLSPFTAANATCALNAALWDFRFRAMGYPFLGQPIVAYSTVQFLGSTSLCPRPERATTIPANA